MQNSNDKLQDPSTVCITMPGNTKLALVACGAWSLASEFSKSVLLTYKFWFGRATVLQGRTAGRTAETRFDLSTIMYILID